MWGRDGLKLSKAGLLCGLRSEVTEGKMRKSLWSETGFRKVR